MFFELGALIVAAGYWPPSLNKILWSLIWYIDDKTREIYGGRIERDLHALSLQD